MAKRWNQILRTTISIVNPNIFLTYPNSLLVCLPDAERKYRIIGAKTDEDKN